MKNKLIYLFIFSLSMGFLEAIVVVYLRLLYYSDGFKFPLVFLPENILMIEILREICTISMLITVAFLASHNSKNRWIAFLFSFGVWDIFYYVGLLFFLQWPESFATWDLLFLIPWPWIGPVWAPILISSGMIAVAIRLIYIDGFRFSKVQLFSLVIGLMIMLSIFMKDYFIIINQNHLWAQFFQLAANPLFIETSLNYIPTDFPSIIFLIGFLLAIVPLGFPKFKPNKDD